MSSSLANSFILNLDSSQTTLEVVGGKGASLARMAAVGLPVPPGFHVTTDAYRRFLDGNNLGEEILTEVARVDDNYRELAGIVVGPEPQSLTQASLDTRSDAAATGCHHPGSQAEPREVYPNVLHDGICPPTQFR